MQVKLEPMLVLSTKNFLEKHLKNHIDPKLLNYILSKTYPLDFSSEKTSNSFVWSKEETLIVL